MWQVNRTPDRQIGTWLPVHHLSYNSSNTAITYQGRTGVGFWYNPLPLVGPHLESNASRRWHRQASDPILSCKSHRLDGPCAAIDTRRPQKTAASASGLPHQRLWIFMDRHFKMCKPIGYYQQLFLYYSKAVLRNKWILFPSNFPTHCLNLHCKYSLARVRACPCFSKPYLMGKLTTNRPFSRASLSIASPSMPQLSCSLFLCRFKTAVMPCATEVGRIKERYVRGTTEIEQVTLFITCTSSLHLRKQLRSAEDKAVDKDGNPVNGTSIKKV